MRATFVVLVGASRAVILNAAFAACVGAQPVGTPLVSPSAIAVAVPAVVTFTVKITPPAGGAVLGVNLIRYDRNGLNPVTVARMFDDATNGDRNAGDSIFAAQLTISEPTPAALLFGASVAFRGQPTRVLSPPGVLAVQANTTAKGTLASLALEIESGNLDAALKRFSTSSLNRDVLASLAPADRQKFAAALTGAVLISSDGGVATFELSWQVSDGQVAKPRMTLVQSQTGEWVVTSW